MSAIEDKLNKLQTDLEKIDKDIADAKGTLEDTQKTISKKNGERNELNAQIAPLKKQVDEVSGSRSAIEEERNAAGCEISLAKKALDDLTEELNEKVPEGRRKAIDDAVESVDADIGKKKEDADKLRQQVAVAEQALAQVQGKASTHESAAADLKTQLKNLSNQVKAFRGRVSDLKSQAKTAAKNGQTTDAYYLTGQLKEAIEQLEKLVAPKYEKDLVKQLDEHQKEVLAAKDAVTAKTAEVEQLRADLAAADRAYQDAAKGREKTIKDKLKTIPEERKESQAAPVRGQRAQPVVG